MLVPREWQWPRHFQPVLMGRWPVSVPKQPNPQGPYHHLCGSVGDDTFCLW